MAALGSVIEGKYEILKEIGKGGMSVVYLAMDKRLNKQWAVKEIRKTASGKNNEVIVNSLLAEANLMKRLDHPALPRIVDIIDNGVTIFIVMDYIEGESLDKILSEYGAQSEDIVINWAKQLCDALNYLHSQKPPIIYRDVKPANIMLKPEGNLKVIDFGIAREYKEQNLADTTVLGTKGYAPPEQHGSRQTDGRSDIYALGMTMHHLLTGVDPRPADYMYLPVRQWNPELSDGIEAIINKCTALNPDDRYQNCSELMYDLEHPDLITKDYKKKQKNKLKMFVTSAILSVLMVISGMVCNISATQINKNNYDQLTSISTTTTKEEKIESYKQAISIDPYNPKAYKCMLDAYEDEGSFTTNDNSEFIALYNANKDGFDNSSKEVAELNYQIGIMYFSYYNSNTNDDSFQDRINRAHPFFKNNYENKNISAEFDKKDISNCYFEICDFYKKYVTNKATTAEASKNDYDELFGNIDECINVIETSSSANPYDKLSLYNGVFMLIYDQKTTLSNCYNGDSYAMQNAIDLFDDVYEKAKVLTPNKEQSLKLKNEIIDNYDLYRKQIKAEFKID